MSTLWLAEVEHVEVPGTRLALFFQEASPTLPEIYARFPEHDPEELYLEAVFDLSIALDNESHNKKALAAFIAAGGLSTT